MKEREKTGGRKAGTPNKATALIRQRIDDADPIGFMISIVNGENIDGGQPTLSERARAAEWLGRKIAPDAKERPIAFTVEALESPKDAIRVIGNVIEAMGKGKVTPSEANSVCGVINQYMKAYELNEIDDRLTHLEKSINLGLKNDA